VCLQETKLTDEAFTDLLGAELARRDYQIAVHGQGQWNGVAILSRAGLDDVVTGLAGGPGFPGPEARAVAATRGGVRGRLGVVAPRRGGSPPPAAGSGSGRCTSPPAGHRARITTSTSWPGWPP